MLENVDCFMKSILCRTSPFSASLIALCVSLVATAGALADNPTGTGTASVTKVAGNQTTLLTVTVTPASSPASTGISVTADLSAFGGSTTAQLYDDGTHGDATAGNKVYSLSLNIPATQAGGTFNIPVTISDGQGRNGTASIGLTVLGSFTIYHTNDCHARITPHDWVVPQHGTQPTVFQKVGGAAYMGAKMLSLTAGNVNSLVLDGGDITEGNPIGDFNGNAGSIGFYRLLSQKLKAQARGRGIDAWVVGNHDVRFASYLSNLKNQTDFPVVSINVCQHGTKTPYFQPYVIVTVNGTKVGIIGYTTDSSVVGSDLTSTIDVVPCDWSSTNVNFIHLADTVNTLRNTQGCDVVVLLGHDGHSDLCTQQSSKTNGPVLVDNAVAKIPEIAITGHWHTVCDTVWQPSILNYKTIFMESSSYLKYVGELVVTGAGKYISSTQYPLLNASITPDPDIAAYVQNEISLFNASSSYQADQILGYTYDNLLLDKLMKWWSGDEYPWDGDNSAGGFICDGLKWKATQMWGSCDLSMEVGGGVRSDIAAGPMTYTQVYEMFPWSDDLLYMIKMQGQEIWNFIQNNNCDVGISREWHVTAFDGNLTSITYNGNPIDLNATYNVSINSYIYQTNTFSDTAPSTSTYLCRQALVDYATQFPQSNPYKAGISRYTLNTDFSGGYRAVVLMMNDNDTQTTFDDGFIRLLSATPETLGRLGSYQVPTSLVNPDGSVNHANRLSEIEMYRSYLGFKTGVLKPGDIIETYGKGGFYGGDPEFVDQEGIQSDGVEFKIVGHDDSLAKPEYYSTINEFYNNTYKNHYVKFYARKTGTNTVVDSANTSLTVMDVTAFTAKSLPGNVGDLLQLTGIPTSEYYALRFRCDSAVLASTVGVTGFPPTSQVTSIPTGNQTGPIQLTATASGAAVSSVTTTSIKPVADAEIAQGKGTSNYGTSTGIYIQSQNSTTSGAFQNERGWLKFDLSSLPASSNITGARLQMVCWKVAGASLSADAYGSTNDSWTETGLTWNNQPDPTTWGSVLSSVTLSGIATYTWDVTPYVKTKYAGDKLASLLVKATVEGSTDATSPSYAFDTKEYSSGSNSPLLLIDTPSGTVAPAIAQIQYYYRYSADGVTYGAWTAYQTSTTPPYTVTFNYPSGNGYYQFYTIATDVNGVTEPTPALYDTATTYGLNSPVPTAPEWALIVLGISLVGFAALRLRKQIKMALFLAIAVAAFFLYRI